jgi:hypothetical protein
MILVKLLLLRVLVERHYTRETKNTENLFTEVIGLSEIGSENNLRSFHAIEIYKYN